MTTCFLAPDPIQSKQFIPGTVVPAVGGQLFFYLAGTATKTTVYKDNAAGSAWTNPIVLDSGGEPTAGGEIWFAEGVTVKVVFAPFSDTDPPVSPYWTKDNLAGINDVTFGSTEWVAGATPTFLSASSLRVSGDLRTTYDVGRRLQSFVTAGTSYASITSSAFATGSTTIGLSTSNSIGLDAGLSSINYSILDGANPSVPTLLGEQILLSDPSDRTKTVVFSVSSKTAATQTRLIVSNQGIEHPAALTIGAATATLSVATTVADYISVTSVTGGIISSVPLSSGMERTLVAADIYTLQSSATFAVPTGIHSTQVGDVITLRGENGTTRVAMYQSAAPAFAGQSVALITSFVNSSVSSTQIIVRNLQGFDHYQIEVVGAIPIGVSGDTLHMQGSSTNGSTFFSTNGYFNVVRAFGTDAADYSVVNGNTSSWVLTATSNSVSTGTGRGGVNMTIDLMGINNTNNAKVLSWHGAYGGFASVGVDLRGSGYATTAALNTFNMNALKLFFPSGTIQGNVYVRGYRFD